MSLSATGGVRGPSWPGEEGGQVAGVWGGATVLTLFLQPPEGAPAAARLQRLHRRGEAGSRQVRGQAHPECHGSSKLCSGAICWGAGQMHAGP